MPFRDDRVALRARVASLEGELAPLLARLEASGAEQRSLAEAIHAELSAAVNPEGADALRARVRTLESSLAAALKVLADAQGEEPARARAPARKSRAMQWPLVGAIGVLLLAMFAWIAPRGAVRTSRPSQPSRAEEQVESEPAPSRGSTPPRRTGAWSGRVVDPGWTSLELGDECTITTLHRSPTSVYPFYEELLVVSCRGGDFRTTQGDLVCEHDRRTSWPTSCSARSGGTHVDAVFEARYGQPSRRVRITTERSIFEIDISERESPPEW